MLKTLHENIINKKRLILESNSYRLFIKFFKEDYFFLDIN